MTETEKAYFAAIIDGEGSLMIKKKKPRRTEKHPSWEPTLCVYNTDRRLIDWLASQYPGYIRERNNSNPNHKRIWYYVVSGAKVFPLLEEIQEYLMLKGRQAELLFEMKATITRPGIKGHPASVYEERERINQEIKRLNHRGVLKDGI